MTTYTVDGVALVRYLVDALPGAADDAFRRAEQGIDVLEAPTVTIGEAIWATVDREEIAGQSVETTPNPVLRGLVHDGPVVIQTDSAYLRLQAEAMPKYHINRQSLRN